ncbi:MAG: SGNH/GDSL hydrolase family protein [Cyclobacteriaceae bacterium]|nr:SGNH/GDSL hydrolase family protein [Cyclobacteriaceae bacterium]
MMKWMHLAGFLLGFAACNPSGPKSNESETTSMNPKTFSYLALGDSYTIGEGVPEEDRYPNQLVFRLNRETDAQWKEAEIIAKTGWTVDELDEGINQAAPTGEPYDLVTLLIGVNNQYRGRSVDEYRVDFEQMLRRAIRFAGNLPDHVVVLSIPDWAVTPFASKRGTDQNKVKQEIDAYNDTKKAICNKFGVKFIDITEDYREIGNLPEMLAPDDLHPSGKVYERWTEKLFEHVKNKY